MSQSLCFLALGLPAETTVPAAPGPCLIQPAYSVAATEFDLKIELHRRKKMIEKIEDESQIRGASASEVVVVDPTRHTLHSRPSKTEAGGLLKVLG